MTTFNFGDPNLFVQGVVDQWLFDPLTGNVIGFDNVGSDVALNYTFDLSEITGGLKNQLIAQIAHTTRLTGTYTSQAFSLAQRALLSGGNIEYNGVAPICRKITATGNTLTVPTEAGMTLAKSYSQPASDVYGWCQVRRSDAANYAGANYGIDLTTGVVQNFTAEAGVSYDVFFFASMASNKVLAVSASANPSVVSVRQRWAVYANQNGATGKGTLQGYLYVEVPRAMLTGDAGIDGNQTTNSTTSYSWTAVTPNDNLPSCADCGEDSENLMYYIYVPCGDAMQSVTGLAVIGGSVSVAVGDTAQIPVKYVMEDGSLIQPNFSDMTYQSAATGTATVSNGVITGVSAGTTTVTITLARADQASISTVCTVVVTA